jgi:hypothetical protein
MTTPMNPIYPFNEPGVDIVIAEYPDTLPFAPHCHLLHVVALLGGERQRDIVPILTSHSGEDRVTPQLSDNCH